MLNQSPPSQGPAPPSSNCGQSGNSARARINAAFDADLLQVAGRQLVCLLSDHLRAVQAGSAPALNWNEPAENVSAAHDWLAEGGSHAGPAHDDDDPLVVRFTQIVRDTLARGQNLHHPHYVGHQVPASVPVAGLFDAIGSVTNQVMAIYEMGPWATAVERAVLEAVGQRIGFAKGSFAGLVTSGASLANLTALLTARNVALGDSWRRGLSRRDEAPVLVAHAEAHYCIGRAAGILGIGADQVIPAALDHRRAMDPNRLDETLGDLRRRGTPIIAVAAAACATPIGAFDPLSAIVDVCRRHEVWLHVDAAHGGALCMSERHRHLVAGLAEADSVVCDAHKMFFMPALCALLFYGNRDHRFMAFDQVAPYLFDPAAPELAEYDSGLCTVECTKRAAAFGLWGVWSLFGPQLFADMVDVTIDLAKEFYQLLQAAPDFETLYEPECNIVVFRHVPESLRDAPAHQTDDFQLRLRRKVIESGEFYLVSNRLDGRSVLRTTIINPLTQREHLEALLEALRQRGERMLADGAVS